jgi:predicted Zn-dependent protease
MNLAAARRGLLRPLAFFALLAFLCTQPAGSRTPGARAAPAAETSDPLLQAMLQELERSKSQLKMENMLTPYYIEYRVAEVDEYAAEAVFGALRQEHRLHLRVLRAVVRVGDYKQDSYFGQGQGFAEVIPLDNDPLAIRHQLWWATDRAYKAAIEALTAKQAMLKQFKVDQPVDDFARAPSLESIGRLARLDVDAKRWRSALETATALFRQDAEVQSLEAALRFTAVNRYLVSSEGTIIRRGQCLYQLSLNGSTQASDGMLLERSPYYLVGSEKELPAPEKFTADTAKMLETLKKLREAPLIEEEYRGPVLMAADAANDVFAGLVGPNVVGRKPAPGKSSRTTGSYATSFKSRVLPEFLSVVDDPTLADFNGHSLVGGYEVDDEGVKAARVPVVENGELINYLLGRQPIRDFPGSNGHGRAAPGGFPLPSLGVLIVRSSQTVSREELKAKMLDICRKRDLPYGYLVETLGPQLSPRLLYRVWAKDGREELVRGGVFQEFDTRELRNDLIAVGNDPEVSNRPGGIPTTVIAPSILFGELEVKRADTTKEKLPDYPPPAFTAPRQRKP